MHFLHWILYLTLLLLHYVTAHPITSASKTGEHIQRMEIVMKSFGILEKSHCKNNTSTFYSASAVTDDCLKQALNYTLPLLDEVKSTCFKIDRENFYEIRSIRDNLKFLFPRNETAEQAAAALLECPQGVNFTKKPFKDFLSNLKTFVQRLNSKY